MTRARRHLARFFAVGGLALLCPLHAAQALTIDLISGVFSNTIGGSNKSFAGNLPVPGFGTGIENVARWGRGPGTDPNSGLGFTPNTPGLEVQPESEFVLGRVRHFNHPITSPATSTMLTITLSIAGATPPTAAFPYTFVIDETDNLEPCEHPGTTICPDRIDNTSSHSGVTFFVGATEYTLSILGWRTGPSMLDPFTNAFISEEGGDSAAYLVAKITTNLVPEPGTALLLAAGLMGLARASRRRLG